MSRINCFGDEFFFGEILPDYYLVQLNNTFCDDPENEYKEGCWGLTYCNDPDFVFYLDPDKDNDAAIEHYEDQLVGPIQYGYRLWKSCLDAGYNPDKDGYAIQYWLVERIVEFLKNINHQPEIIYLHNIHRNQAQIATYKKLYPNTKIV